MAERESGEKLGKDLEDDVQGNKKLLYSLAKSYRKGNTDECTTVKDESGNLLTDREHIEERWKQYFEQLLNIAENSTDISKANDDEQFGLIMMTPKPVTIISHWMKWRKQ